MAFNTLTCKLHLRRMVHLFADSLLSIATPGSIRRMTAKAGVGAQTVLRLVLPAGPGQNEFFSDFGVALGLAHRLGIATMLRLDPIHGHEQALTLPPAQTS